MKREILFKAKRVDNGEWVESCSIVHLFDNNRNVIAVGFVPVGTSADATDVVPVEPETVCQYTGLRDSNGQRIFEGDIMNRSMFTGVVLFKFSRWQIEPTGDSEFIHYPSFYGNAVTFEVVGNIHDKGDDDD